MGVLPVDVPDGHGTRPGFSAGGTLLPWALASVEGIEILPAAQVTCLQNGWCWRKAKGFDQGVIEMWWSKGLNLLPPGSATHWDVQSNPCQLEKVEESKSCCFLLGSYWTLPLSSIPLLCLSFPLPVKHRRMFFPFYHQVLWDG